MPGCIASPCERAVVVKKARRRMEKCIVADWRGTEFGNQLRFAELSSLEFRWFCAVRSAGESTLLYDSRTKDANIVV